MVRPLDLGSSSQLLARQMTKVGRSPVEASRRSRRMNPSMHASCLCQLPMHREEPMMPCLVTVQESLEKDELAQRVKYQGSSPNMNSARFHVTLPSGPQHNKYSILQTKRRTDEAKVASSEPAAASSEVGVTGLGSGGNNLSTRTRQAAAARAEARHRRLTAAARAMNVAPSPKDSDVRLKGRQANSMEHLTSDDEELPELSWGAALSEP
mmetsp:Transcript_33774/g.62521  ORF Transcript_33774/g.62521 Transcript_33774/m.62521 type:complete len:210 (-) Transcript_33774:62-691(-)